MVCLIFYLSIGPTMSEGAEEYSWTLSSYGHIIYQRFELHSLGYKAGALGCMTLCSGKGKQLIFIPILESIFPDPNLAVRSRAVRLTYVFETARISTGILFFVFILSCLVFTI